ncbi:glycosyltransferase [Brachybacterium paraconglomeratum]
MRPTASGGLAAHVDQELALLKAAGHEVREAPVRIRERPDLIEDLRTVRTLRRLLASSEATATLHAHGLRAGALAAVAMWGLRRHRLVVTLHNRTVGSRPTRAVGALLLRLLVRRANAVLAVSPDLIETARKAGAGDVRHAIIPAPVPDPVEPAEADRAADPAHSADGTTAAAPAVPGASDGERRRRLEVLVIARLAPQKGLHDLLDAAALLRDGAPVLIRVAGDGPLATELSARIDAEQLPVELLGRRDDVPALLSACDLLVSAAHWEGQPVSLQEALRAGRAIVATDAGGTRWVTADAAHLVPVSDPAALAAAITRMQDPALRSAAEQSAHRRALELPTAEDLLAQLDEVLAPGPHHW